MPMLGKRLGPTVQTRSRTAGLKEFEKGAVARFIRKRCEAVDNFQAQYYPSWYEALAFLQNEHYATFMPGVGYYEPEKASQETYRAVVNYITGGHLNMIAKTTKTKPRVTFSPMGSGHVREDAARFMRQVDEYLHARLDRERVFNEMLGWAYAIGMGFDKSFWNPNGGDLILTKKIGSTGEERRREYYEDLNDSDIPVFKREMTGEIAHESRSGFELGWDPSVTFYDSLWIREIQVWEIDQFREEFPDTFHIVRPSSETDYLPMEFWKVHLMQNLQARFHPHEYGGTASAPDRRNKARIIEFHHAPTDVWPEGALIHWTPDHVTDGESHGILNISTCPNKLDDPDTGIRRIWQWHPYSMMVDIPIPGKSIPLGSVQYAIPVQQMINREVSSIQEFINMAAKYRILIQEGLGEIDRDEFKDHHMNFVEVKGDPKGVQPMPVPQMSSEVKEMRNWLERALDKIMMQTLDDEAQAVRSGLSGDAIEYLDALQQIKMLPRIAMFVRALCRTSRHQLLLAKKHYGDDPVIDRFITLAGRGGSTRVRNFDADLIALDFTVRCEGVSDLSRSVAARKAEILKYYNAGAFGPPASAEAARRMLRLSEFGNVDDVYEDVAVTENLVNNRLDAILDNTDMPNFDDGPWHFEDHKASLVIIDTFRRKYYATLTKVQRQRVDYLAAAHNGWIAKKALIDGAGLNAGADGLAGGPGGGEEEMTPPNDATTIESGGTDADVNQSTQDATEGESKYAKVPEGEK